MGRYLPLFTAALFLVVAAGFAWLFVFTEAPTPIDRPEPEPRAAIEAAKPEAMPEPEPEPESAEPIEAAPRAVVKAESTPEGVGRITGTIEYGASVPAGSAEAQLYLQPEQGTMLTSDLELVATQPTNGAENFSFTGLAPAKYFVAVVAGDSAGFDSAEIKDDDLEKEVSIYFGDSGIILGRVVMAGGGAAVDAAVIPAELVYSGGRGSRRIQGSMAGFLKARTSDEGDFTLFYLDKESYRLCVVVDGYPPHYTEPIEVGTKGVRIVVGAGGSLSGILTELDTKRPMGGVELKLTGPFQDDTHDVVTDDNGQFDVASIGLGAYRVSMDNAPYVLMPDSRSIEVAASQVTRTELVAVVGGTITGRVYNASTEAPVSGARIMASRQAGWVNSRSQETGPDGNYEIKGLPPGAYELGRNNEVKGFPRQYESQERNEMPLVQLATGATLEGVDIKMYPGIEITGVVRDRDGNPLEDVSLNGRSPQGMNYAFAQTEDDGRFSMTVVNATSDFSISARKSGFGTTTANNLDIAAEGLHGVEIVLGPASSVAGVLVDEAGRLVGKGGVYLTLQGDMNSGSGEQVKSDGTFLIGGLGAGTYNVHPSRQSGSYQLDNSPDAQSVTVGEGEELKGLRVVLRGAGGMAITGFVRDSAGKGIKEARLWASGSIGSASAQTDTEGAFALEGLQEGTYQVHASHQSYTNDNLRDIPAGTQGLEIILSGHGAISGVVLDGRTRQPVERFQVAQTKYDRVNLQYANFNNVLSAEGRFTLAGVDAGQTTVYVRADGYQEGSAQVPSVIEGETAGDIEIYLQPGGGLSGIVIDTQNNPISGAMIIEGRFDERSAARAARATTGADGRFELSGLPEGRAQITAYHTNYAPSGVDVDSAQSAEIQIVLSQGGVIEGTVMEAGRPLANQYVSFSDPVRRNNTSVTTDADGRYRKEGLAPGTYQLSSSLQAGDSGQRRSKSRTAEVQDGMTTVVDFNWSPSTASLSGVVTSGDAPVAGIQISLQVTSAEGIEHFNTQTDTRGVYLLEGLPAGMASGTAYKDDGRTQRRFNLEIAAGKAHEYNISLTGGAKVVCRISGAPQGRVMMAMLTTNLEVQRPQNEADMQAMAHGMVGTAPVVEGVVQFEGIEPGTYALVVVAYPEEQTNSPEVILREMHFLMSQVTVPSGETVETQVSF